MNEKKDLIIEAFKLLDRDKDGFLSRNELEFGFCELKLNPSSQEIDYFFKFYDLNKDGKIDFPEFYRFWISIDCG
ncbi:unnamed protein product [Brachionus calyciflorus]|uniref:EF-hand domain-containing protein n=1 Tax=Brachionus calyciflorus TaxID=104777 RepID=A0A814I3H7_9BILA|nr:unnamed protein product [Brachionus calyciflorus]